MKAQPATRDGWFEGEGQARLLGITQHHGSGSSWVWSRENGQCELFAPLTGKQLDRQEKVVEIPRSGRVLCGYIGDCYIGSK